MPVSVNGRGLVWKRCKGKQPAELVFSTSRGTGLSKRNAERDLAVLGKRLRFTQLRPHLLRHTFATFYIRKGGNVLRLQRILGHTTIGMTMKYVHLQTSDLTAVHSQFSPVSGLLQ